MRLAALVYPYINSVGTENVMYFCEVFTAKIAIAESEYYAAENALYRSALLKMLCSKCLLVHNFQ